MPDPSVFLDRQGQPAIPDSTAFFSELSPELRQSRRRFAEQDGKAGGSLGSGTGVASRIPSAILPSTAAGLASPPPFSFAFLAFGWPAV